MNNPTEPDILEGEDVAKKEVSAAPVVLIDDLAAENDEIAEERQDAFDSGIYKWRGKHLEPFSSSRDALFVRLRKRLGSPSLSEVFTDLGLFVQDAQLILWLCSTPYSKLLGGLGSPDLLLEQMFTWTDENATRADMGACVTLALEIYNDSRINAAESAPDDDPLNTGELGN